MAGRIYECEMRVPYAHIDKMGFVYYANYLVYFEMARAKMLREAGLPYALLEEKGVMLPVVKAFCEYRKPAFYDDLLAVHTRCVEPKGTRLRMEYEIVRKALGNDREGAGNGGKDVIVAGYTEHVCVSREGKVLRPVPELVRMFGSEK